MSVFIVSMYMAVFPKVGSTYEVWQCNSALLILVDSNIQARTSQAN